MTANQRNFQIFTYTDDGGTVWNKRGTLDAAINAVDGSSALTAAAPVWIDSPRKHTRQAVFQDPQTFRTIRVPIYTAAAFSTLASGGGTVAVNVPGETTTVAYSLAELIPERQPIAKSTRQLADHT